MRFFDYRVTAIRPLNEAKAVELGASFISESLLFSVAGFTILFEAWRSSRKASSRVVSVDEALARLEAERLMDVESLGVLNEEFKALRNESEALRKAVVSLAQIVEGQEPAKPASAGWFLGAWTTPKLPIEERFDELREALEESRRISNNITVMEQQADARSPVSVAANVVEAGLIKPT
ncbi:hypothetical protein HDU67_000483 [Dinochytrium kinnereticum]|nr:hypothetical protein HDU67_000483 [Dinochytrium kinnereticum]